MAAPTVSVVMPTFNRVKYLRAAIASVHAQRFGDWELIVVDDGSNEQTLGFLRGRADSRTTLFCGPHTGNPQPFEIGALGSRAVGTSLS